MLSTWEATAFQPPPVLKHASFAVKPAGVRDQAVTNAPPTWASSAAFPLHKRDTVLGRNGPYVRSQRDPAEASASIVLARALARAGATVPVAVEDARPHTAQSVASARGSGSARVAADSEPQAPAGSPTPLVVAPDFDASEKPGLVVKASERVGWPALAMPASSSAASFSHSSSLHSPTPRRGVLARPATTAVGYRYSAPGESLSGSAAGAAAASANAVHAAAASGSLPALNAALRARDHGAGSAHTGARPQTSAVGSLGQRVGSGQGRALGKGVGAAARIGVGTGAGTLAEMALRGGPRGLVADGGLASGPCPVGVSAGDAERGFGGGGRGDYDEDGDVADGGPEASGERSRAVSSSGPFNAPLSAASLLGENVLLREVESRGRLAGAGAGAEGPEDPLSMTASFVYLRQGDVTRDGRITDVNLGGPGNAGVTGSGDVAGSGVGKRVGALIQRSATARIDASSSSSSSFSSSASGRPARASPYLSTPSWPPSLTSFAASLSTSLPLEPPMTLTACSILTMQFGKAGQLKKALRPAAVTRGSGVEVGLALGSTGAALPVAVSAPFSRNPARRGSSGTGWAVALPSSSANELSAGSALAQAREAVAGRAGIEPSSARGTLGTSAAATAVSATGSTAAGSGARPKRVLPDTGPNAVLFDLRAPSAPPTTALSSSSIASDSYTSTDGDAGLQSQQQQQRSEGDGPSTPPSASSDGELAERVHALAAAMDARDGLSRAHFAVSSASDSGALSPLGAASGDANRDAATDDHTQAMLAAASDRLSEMEAMLTEALAQGERDRQARAEAERLRDVWVERFRAAEDGSKGAALAAHDARQQALAAAAKQASAEATSALDKRESAMMVLDVARLSKELEAVRAKLSAREAEAASLKAHNESIVARMAADRTRFEAAIGMLKGEAEAAIEARNAVLAKNQNLAWLTNELAAVNDKCAALTSQLGEAQQKLSAMADLKAELEVLRHERTRRSSRAMSVTSIGAAEMAAAVAAAAATAAAGHAS